jgi:hypothetical protein
MVAYGKFCEGQSPAMANKLEHSYCRIAESAFCDGLEEGGFTNVGETNLHDSEFTKQRGLRSSLPTYDAALQAVARPAQENLLGLGFLLGRHLSFSFGVKSNGLEEW